MSYIFRIELYDNGKQITVDIPYLLDNKDYDIDVSIVVPSYNEQTRLPPMMKETLDVSSREKILQPTTTI